MEDNASAIVKWVSTFSGLSQSCESIEDLGDGIVLSEILGQLLPSAIGNSFDNLRKEAGGNFLMKAHNIKKLLRVLDDAVYTGRNISASLDIDAIAKDNSASEIVKLSQLVLGCVPHSADNEIFVSNIMALDQEVMQSLMLLIQEVMQQDGGEDNDEPGPSSADSSFEMKSSSGIPLTPSRSADGDVMMSTPSGDSDLSAIHMMGAKTAMRMRMRDEFAEDQYKQQIEALKTERDDLRRDRATLEKNLEEAVKEKSEFRQKLDQLEDERIRNFSSSSSPLMAPSGDSGNAKLDELRAEIAERDRRLSDLSRKNEELSRFVQDARALQDEVDILRSRAAEADKLTAEINKYKTKISELSNAFAEKKTMQEQYNRLLDSKLDVDDQLVKANSYKEQVEKYKKEVTDLRSELLVLKASDAESSGRLQDLQSVLDDNKSLKAQISSLQARLAESSSPSLSSDSDNLGGLSSSSSSSAASNDFGGLVESVTPEMKERLSRLERENKALKEQNSSGKISELEDSLDDARRMKEKLEKDFLDSKAKISALEAEKRSMISKAEASLSERDSILSAELDELKTETSHLKKERDSLRSQLTAAQAATESLKEEMASQQTILEADLLQANTKIASLTASSDSWQRKYKDAQGEMESIRSQQASEANDKLRALEATNADLKERAKKLQEQIIERSTKHSEETATLRNQLTEMQDEVDLLKRRSADEAESLRKSKQAVEAELSAAQQHITAMTLAATSGSVDDRETIARLSSELETIRRQYSEQKSESSTLRSERDQISAEKATALLRLQEQLSNTQALLDKANSTISSSYSERESFSQQVSESQRKIEALEEQNRTYQSVLSNSTAAREEETDRIAQENAALKQIIQKYEVDRTEYAEKQFQQSQREKVYTEELARLKQSISDSPSVSSSIQSHVVQEKDDQIKLLQTRSKALEDKLRKMDDEYKKRWFDAKQAAEMEQNLIVGACYDLAMELTKLRSRMGAVSQPAQDLKSWINRKRAAIERS